LIGAHVTRWLNVEISQVLSSRLDLLGATADDSLVHIELQSTNDPEMALRMAEYSLRIYRQFKKFPRQIVLYVGEPKLRMKAELSGPDSTFQYTLIDARELDGNQLLASSRIEDNLMAILARLENRTETIRKILERIARLEKPKRRDALAKLLIITGIRTLEETIKEEALKMPILNDIMDNKVFGPVIRQSRQEGKQEILHRLLNKRFGPIPDWVENHLAALPADNLDDVAVGILDASSFEDLFPSKH
jgi:predicted transposase YdaD